MKNLKIKGVILDYCDEDFDGICAADKFVAELNATDDDVEITIDSVGGSVYASREMSFALARWCLDHPTRNVAVQIGSLCASAAANFIVALPRSVKVTAYANSLVMFHSCSGGAIGNPEDLRSTAEEMDKINESVQFGLLQKTTLPPTQIKEAFLAGHEMWLTGKDALDCGLVDELVDGMVSITAFASTKYAEKYDIEQIVATYRQKQEKIMEEEIKDNIEVTEQTITAEATENTEETEETTTAEENENKEETTAENEETTEETEETQECDDEEKTALKAQNEELTNKITALEAEISELKATIEKYKPTAKANKPSEKADWLTMVKELNAKHLPEQEYAKAYVALKNEHNTEFKAFMEAHQHRG